MDKIKEGQTIIEHIYTKAMVTDPMTKRLDPEYLTSM